MSRAGQTAARVAPRRRSPHDFRSPSPGPAASIPPAGAYRTGGAPRQLEEAMVTTTEVIERLRRDPEAYAAAVLAEGAAWSEQFAADRAKTIRAADQEAALRLRPGRQSLQISALAREKGWHFSRGLSLGCGSGRAERELMTAGICDSFVGIDVSPGVLDEARRTANGFDIEYRIGDINKAELGCDEFDLVLAQNCLHHVLELEFVADRIWRCLKPGGVLWISDFVGETQFQWSDERLRLANEVLAILPERYRRFRLHDFTLGMVRRPEVGNLASPFEAIRSGEIIPIFAQRFEIEIRNEFDCLMSLLCPVGARANYLETEDGPVVFELLMLLDRLLVDNGILAPVGGQYLMRKRA
jgi:SAM-dependent methyltransferase